MLKRYFIEILIIISSLLFSFWLMFHTFYYSNGTMHIATKAWSDFASHIPLIRSFSLGDNFPPQYPLFSGEPIRYHFLFYALVGLLERLGLRIDLALNIPSAFSFAGLIIIIYFLAKTLFRSKAIGVLSVIFFLFNGSFSFLEFFKDHPLSTKTIQEIIANTIFPSFAPYGKGIVSAFWNLNIYTNQRHLALPIAILLFIIFHTVRSELRREKISWLMAIILGIIVGILPFSHSSLFIMLISVLSILFLLLPRQRISLLILLFLSFLVSLPRIVFLEQTATFIPQVSIGYLINNNLSFQTFLSFWVENFGLFFFLIPIGVLFSSTLAKKVFLSFFSLFVMGNLIQFSPEMAANHKFFNVFLIVGNMFVAFLIVKLWKKKLLTQITIILIFPFLILSGIIDFFPIKNDRFISVSDYQKNPDIAWIMEETPKDAVFLNSSYLYHPASLAGRKIFLGWPYFAWSLGYNTDERDIIQKKLFTSTTTTSFCETNKRFKLDYVAIDSQKDKDFTINNVFFERNFLLAYQNNLSGIKIYSTKLRCGN